jgi:hypothetical protein
MRRVEIAMGLNRGHLWLLEQGKVEWTRERINTFFKALASMDATTQP